MDTMSFARLLCSLLLDSAAKGTVLLLVAWLAVELARRSSAALRHSIWCMAMVGLLLSPVAAWLLPTWQIPILPPSPATVAEVRLPGPARASVETGESPLIGANSQLPGKAKQFEASGFMVDASMAEASSLVPLVVESPAAIQSIVESDVRPLSIVELVLFVVSAVWILGVTVFGSLLVVGLWRTVCMRNRSVVIVDGEWPRMLTELRQRLGLSRSVELREHADSVVPLTWGIWRPVVLVPQIARDWAEPMRRAVLLHELAHVQRGDVACQVLGRLTCVLYWFHPLSWFALRQLRQEREQACDDAVVHSGEKASDYAEQLLAVARLCCAPRGLSLGVAMAEGSSLERRVIALFDSARSHGPLTRRVAIASLVIGGAILAGLAPIQPTASQAESVKVETSEPAEPQPAQILESRIHDGEAAKKQMENLQPVFGKAKLGIQLGLAIGSLERTFPEGGRIPLWLFYRNVGDKELTFRTSQDYMNDPVTVTDENGKRVQVSFMMHWMDIAPLTITLKPGEVWCIATTGLNLGQPMPSIKPVTGKYKLTYPQGIWDVNTTPQLRTDIPVLPSLPPNLSPANPDAPPSPDTPVASPATPVGQMVETPNWSERLETGTIEFEIAPGKDGQPEARVLAMADAVAPLDELVVWGKPVDGLQAGFWPASTGEPLNQRVPLDAMVEYHVVVKNTSSEARNVCWQLISFDRGEVPWLIPSDQIVPAMELPAPPAQFRAVGSPNPFSGIDPAFIVRLEPNETVMVPGPQRLWIGKTLPKEHQYTPHLADLTAGMNWIVQPLRVKTLTDKERFEYKSTTQTAITVYDAQGQSRTVKADTIPARYADPSIYARIQLEVGTLNAEAHRSAEQATWGEVDRGLQCGIRLLNPQASYQTGDTIQAELLYRNSSDKVLITTQPRSTDFWARVEDSAGRQLSIDDGARLDLLPYNLDYQPGEIRSLGTLKVKLVAAGTPSPKDNREPGHITLPPGKYRLHGSGGVGEINPHSGKISFIVAEPIAEQQAAAGSKTISGQIINDLKLGIPNAEVLIVAGGDLNDPREGKVIAQGKTDVLGNYSIAIPEAELGKRSWGQVWRRAPGFAATRGNTVQSLESLTQQPLQHNPLVSTEGLHLVVQDPAGKPLANARVEAISVKVNQGIGYTLPAAWRDDNSGVSDAEGRVHLPYIDPGSLNQLEITPEGSSAATRFSPNYFLNYRPEETAPHFIFPTYKTGTIEGQLVAGPGVTLPKDLKIPLMTLTGKVDVAGVREVTVDQAGRFQIPDMPIGEISILKFLDDAQPLRSWISERAFVKADETTKLEIPIVTGTRVTGRVQKSDTKASVPDYEFEVYYGPAIKFRGSDLWLLKHPVKTDAEGKYELLLPPGPINLRLTRYVDGYSDATSWLPRKQQGTWGPLFEIPAQADFELPSIDLVKMLPIQGTLIDQNDQPLIAFDWMVYGYPEIPGEEDGFVMNSMAGVQTDKTGHFDGTYPETYPPVRWSVSHRVWKTKYEFDDLKYAAKVVTRDPLVLRVDTTTPLEE